MSCQVESIEALLVDLPTIRPHKLSMTTMGNQTLVIVRMRHSDDIEGLGEATTIGGSPVVTPMSVFSTYRTMPSCKRSSASFRFFLIWISRSRRSAATRPQFIPMTADCASRSA